MQYEQYDLKADALRVFHYIDGMTDRAYDFLPFWLVKPHKKPAEAEHCRVDDAELVGSWFEAVDSLKGILGDNETLSSLYQGFRRRVLSSWGDKGLRYHEPYPWTHTMHASFHEMGYILPALNRMLRNDPRDTEAEERARELVAGMRSLVIERQVKTFWSGDSYLSHKCYEFPNDVYLMDGGFDLTRFTGRGDPEIRNGVILHALADRYALTGDAVALDLAEGLAYNIIQYSRFFTYDYRYHGHVHSVLWIAAGLLYLSRLTHNEKFFTAGRRIYQNTRREVTAFGWVPEYLGWNPRAKEHCETCCIKSMILCMDELIKCGEELHWDDMNKFARNQLTENQIKYTGYVVTDDSLEDKDGKTYRHLDKRILGGYTGGAEVNSISLTRFRSIAGCCVGTAPIALGILWSYVACDREGILTVNLHTEKETDAWHLTHSLPDRGHLRLELKRDTPAAGFRRYEWMGKEIQLRLNDRVITPLEQNGILYARDLSAKDVLELCFPLETVVMTETFDTETYTEYWRGADMVDLLPRGDHIRLYQRDKTIPKYYPTAADLEYTGDFQKGPTKQSK